MRCILHGWPVDRGVQGRSSGLSEELGSFVRQHVHRVAHVLASGLGSWGARAARLRRKTHERGEVSNVLQDVTPCVKPLSVQAVVRPRWFPSAASPPNHRRPFLGRTLHIESLAQSSVRLVKCGSRSFGEEVISMARRAKPVRGGVKRCGDDSCTYAPLADACVSRTVLPQHLLASLVRYMGFCTNETLRDHRDFAVNKARVRKPPSRESCRPDASMRE